MLRRDQIDSTYHSKYFRPSCLPAFNLKVLKTDFSPGHSNHLHKEIALPVEWTRTPDETLINYFSILREAENIGERSCGSIGQGNLPFPLAYNFLSKVYQKKLNYDTYLSGFDGVGHTSLIKLCRVPDEEQSIKFFYEIETIEGFKGKSAEYFGYSFGFIKLVHEQVGYRIIDINQIKEDFLCAPYHRWDHDAESVVDVKYGEWCKLVKKRYPTVTDGYVKSIYFDGNDGADYHFIFFTLTNGTDVEISQFRRVGNGGWKQVKIIPEEMCLPDHPNSNF